MSTAARVLLLAAATAVVAADPGRARGVPVHEPVQLEPAADLARERQTFATTLQAFRSGDDSALAALVESADRMAQLRRADAKDVVAFYRGLSLDERRAGMSAEARYEKSWAEVRAAAPGAGDWPARRAAILAELDALIAERRASADPTPGARALSLAAVLEEQRARFDPALSQSERAALIASVESRAREALKIFAASGLVTPQLEPIWLVGRVEDAKGDVAAARASFEDSLALAQRVDNEWYQVLALRGLIGLAESAGDLAEQRDLMLDLADIREPKDDWWLARRWAALLLGDDEPEGVIRFLATITPKAGDELSQWHFLYGSALQRLGRIDEAESHFAEVRLTPVAKTVLPCDEVQTQVWRAQSALGRGDAKRALELLGPLRDDGCAPDARAQRAYTLGAAHLALGDAVRAEKALRGALDQGRGLEARLARADDGAVFGEVVGLETVALLADALTRQGRPLEAVRVAEEIQARSLRSREDAQITEDDLRAWAGKFQRGLLTWIVGADTTVCAHVGADGTATAVVIQLGRERLQDAVRRAREAAISGDEKRARQLVTEIVARVLPAKLRERTRGEGRILVLAHGPLERLPFDLTELADDGALAVLPGLASARPGDMPTPAQLSDWSILGDPSSGEGQSVLPGARAEADAIASLVGGSALVGDAFDRLALIDALSSDRPLHVATHLVRGCGDADQDAGLLLARGALLCAREIRELAPQLPLAVLAACETAEGRFVDAQALASVSNAFLGSGTRNLCVTLWPIEDGAARRWSESFHRELANGMRPSEAARLARESLKRDGTPVSEWAAFRFVGRD